MRNIVVLVLCLALAPGCGSRCEVAKDKALKQIDALLGTIEVKRKEVEVGIDGLKQGLNGLRKAKIKAQVSRDQIQRQATPLEERLAGIDRALTTLRGHLEAESSVEIAGKTYSAQDVKDLAARVLQARQTCAVQLDGFRSARARLDKVVTTLEHKQREVEGRLASIESQVATIDANRNALEAMRRSAEALGNNDTSLKRGLDHLQAKVNDLYAEVEGELRYEDERWEETAKEIDSVEGVVARFQEPRDVVGEIDRILGGKQ
jgi:chromosome segregation ATPase